MKLVLVVFTIFASIFLANGINIQNLRCEYLTNPPCIDVVSPRLSWILESPQRGERQTAYQVIVSSTKKKLSENQGDLWSSGKVDSDQTIQLEYAGKPLKSGMSCFWKVRVWNSAGKVSEWSKPAFWTMGFLDSEDWKAKWIGVHDPEPSEWARPRYLRKTFQVGQSVRRATVYVQPWDFTNYGSMVSMWEIIFLPRSGRIIIKGCNISPMMLHV